MRIPIKPPGFNGETKEPRCFLRGSLAKNPTGLPDMNFRHVFERIFVPQFVGSILVPSCQPFAACGTKKKTAEKVKMIGRMRSGIGSLRRIEKKKTRFGVCWSCLRINGLAIFCFALKKSVVAGGLVRGSGTHRRMDHRNTGYKGKFPQILEK